MVWAILCLIVEGYTFQSILNFSFFLCNAISMVILIRCSFVFLWKSDCSSKFWGAVLVLCPIPRTKERSWKHATSCSWLNAFRVHVQCLMLGSSCETKCFVLQGSFSGIHTKCFNEIFVLNVIRNISFEPYCLNLLVELCWNQNNNLVFYKNLYAEYSSLIVPSRTALKINFWSTQVMNPSS